MIQTPVIVTFANYLVASVRVVIIDCDFQHLIMKCRKADIKKYERNNYPMKSGHTNPTTKWIGPRWWRNCTMTQR